MQTHQAALKARSQLFLKFQPNLRRLLQPMSWVCPWTQSEDSVPKCKGSYREWKQN